MVRNAIKTGACRYLAEIDAVVLRFPRDPLLPDLEPVISSTSWTRIVNSAVVSGRRPWRSVAVRILGYKPSRRLTLELGLEGEGGAELTVYGKVFPSGLDTRIVEMQRSLEWSLSTNDSVSFGLPPIVGRVQKRNMVLWGRVSSPSVFELLSGGEIEQVVGRTADCLAGLHALASTWRRVHGQQAELDTLASWVSAAVTFEPAIAPAAQSLLARLRSAAAELASGPLVPSHRDFYDKQVLVGESGCTLLDLELASLAEPELDAGNFLAHLLLRELQGRTHRSRELSGVFLERYSERNRILDQRRLKWYRSCSLLRLACVYSLRQEWTTMAPGLLRACGANLDGGLRIEGVA